MKTWLIKLAIKWLKGTDSPLKEEILAEAVRKLYLCVSPDDILRVNSKGEWLYQNRPLPNEEVMRLRTEASAIKNMKLWKVIQNDIRYQISRKVFEEAQVKEDVVWGRLLVFLNDIIETRLNKMS